MRKNMRKPNIRFRNYNNDWEQRKLKNISKINPSSKIPSMFNYVDLESVQGTELKSFRRESIETAPSRAQRLAIKGDLFYQTVRPYQKNNYLFNRDDTDFVFSTGYAQVRPEIDGDFLLSLVQTTKFVNSVLVRCTGTSYPAINSSDLSLVPIKVPKNNDESINIGMLFSGIDNTITLHQRKLNYLESAKTTFLNIMFPKKDANVPEYRFSKYHDDWEQCAFKDVLKSHSFRQYLAEPQIEGEFEIIQQGDKPIVGYADGEPFAEYADVTLFGDHTVSLYKPTKPFFVATDGVKILSGDGFDGQYLFSTLERYKPDSQGYKRHFTILKNEKLWFTKNSEEQLKIGSFFANLDHLITLHQRKLKGLEDIKKYYLKHMFV